jgi:hypothetical protein
MNKTIRCASWTMAIIAVGCWGAYLWKAYIEQLEFSETQATKDWLSNANILRIELHDASIVKAVAELNKCISKLPGKPEGLQIEFAPKHDWEDRYHREHPPGAWASPETGIKNERITYLFTDVPLGTTIEYTAMTAGWGSEIRGRKILLHHIRADFSDFGPLKNAAYENVGIGPAWQAKLGKTVDRDWMNAEPWLIANGITFSKSAYAVWNPKSRALRVRNTQNQLDLISTFCDRKPTMLDIATYWLRDHADKIRGHSQRSLFDP